MGQIRTLQTDYLRKGAEQISYKVFDSDGSYVETIDENVLFSAPQDLTPLNKDLQRQYERPIKQVDFISDLRGDYFKNFNGHFLHGSNSYTTNPNFTFANKTGGTAIEFISDENKSVKALSGGKYFRTDVCASQGGTMTTMLTTDHNYTVIPTDQEVTIDFDYHIRTTSTTSETWFVPVAVLLEVTDTSNVTSNGRYDFNAKEWLIGSNANIQQTSNETTTTNSWDKVSLKIEPYSPPGAQNGTILEYKLTLQIGFPMCKVGTAANFTDLFIDNIRIAESHETENTIVSRRKQFDQNGTYTAKYELKDNVLSNQGRNFDYFIGKIDDDFKRPRDTANKTLEQIITQDVINDSRDFMRKYEGTFRAANNNFLGLHNKIWIDYGSDSLQEPVSCYIDAMKYDVKYAEYDIRMHIPNQDDDVDTTYNVLLE